MVSSCALSVLFAVAICASADENCLADLARCESSASELEAEILDLKENQRSLLGRNAELAARILQLELTQCPPTPGAVGAPSSLPSGPSVPFATPEGGEASQLPSHSSARKPPASRRADALRRQPVSAKGRQLAGHPSFPTPLHAMKSHHVRTRAHTPKPLSAWQVHRQQIGLSCALEGRPH